ncbi:MAG: PLP-dependent aminotransferase family protein, partial [Pseudomonadota bacterium]
MDTKLELPPHQSGPRYRVLADTICQAVARGELSPGAQLPPVRDLAWTLKISPGAVARAYKLGVERGILEAMVGRGTFVRNAGSSPIYAMDGLMDEAATGTIDLRGNQAVDVGQAAALTRALERLIARHDGVLPITGYRRREDDPAALEVFAGWLREAGVPAEASRLLVTSGAQAGVIAVMSLLGRGGGVALTTPTIHPGLRDGAAGIGMRLEAVEADRDGIDPDALDRACTRARPDAIMLTATLQNPTLVLMSAERRRAVAEIAERHQVPVIEDDVYGQLLPNPPQSFATLLPDLCWYVASLSKSVAAGLRAGFVLTPPGKVMPTFRAYQALAHQTPWLVKGLSAEVIESGEAKAIRTKVAAETARRVQIADRLLGPVGAITHPAASFAYLPLPEPWTSAEFVAAAAAMGVLVPPAAIYRT